MAIIHFTLLLRWLVFVAGAPAAFSLIGQLWIENLVWMYDHAIHYLPSAPFLVDAKTKEFLGYALEDGEFCGSRECATPARD